MQNMQYFIAHETGQKSYTGAPILKYIDGPVLLYDQCFYTGHKIAVHLQINTYGHRRDIPIYRF